MATLEVTKVKEQMTGRFLFNVRVDGVEGRIEFPDSAIEGSRLISFLMRPLSFGPRSALRRTSRHRFEIVSQSKYVILK